MSACGPTKSAKEWSKTWRDWKCNTLKKIAKHKMHMMGTGGGSPKHLQLTAVENALIDFLTPDAAGLNNISEGGFENISNDSKQDYSPNFSPVKKERRPKEKLNQYYSTSSRIDDESNMDKISLSDSSEDLTLHSMSQSKRMQSSVMGKKESYKKSETLISCLDYDIQNIYGKENVQDTNDEINNETTSLDSMKYQDIKAKYSQDIKKPKLMTTALNLLEKKTSTSENIKVQLLEIKRQKLQLKRQEIDVRNDTLQVLQNISTTLSSLRDELVGQYLTGDN